MVDFQMDEDEDEEIYLGPKGKRKKKKKKVIISEEPGVEQHKNCNVYVSTNTGHVICYCLNKLFSSEDFKLCIVE